MKERPIVMTGDSPGAILEDRKTQTRRVIKPQFIFNGTDLHDKPYYIYRRKVYSLGDWALTEQCPYGQAGDRLIPLIAIPQLAGRYYADTEGNIWSNAWGKFRKLKGCETHKGYLAITASIKGKRQTLHIHRLICKAFYGEPSEGLTEVRHLDGNPRNNAPDNLDWCSPSQNWLDRLAMNRGVRESHWAAKLTQADVDNIRTSILSQRQLAKIYCVSQATINDIRNNKLWKDLPIQQPPNMPRWASRILLEITGVRVERIHDISRDDIVAEGLPRDQYSYQNRFMNLWDSLNAKRGYGWETNPWVWVINFRRVK